jgi:hypothetical protein
MPCATLISRFALTVQLDGEDVYCLAKAQNNRLIRYRQGQGVQPTPLKLSKVMFYSIAKQQLASAKLVTYNSDIIRTNY